jgi:hypothetical protein
VNNAALVVADGIQILGLFAGPEWGIFDANGQALIVGDSVVAFDQRAESRISKYPLEQGGFESYNKVQVPFDIKFTFTKGGTVAERTAFIASCDAALKSLDLLAGITPEVAYGPINVVHYDMRRDERHGVTLITVDVWCEQVRLAPPLLFSNTQSFTGEVNVGTPTMRPETTSDPTSASPVQNGTVQGQNLGPVDVLTGTPVPMFNIQ